MKEVEETTSTHKLLLLGCFTSATGEVKFVCVCVCTHDAHVYVYVHVCTYVSIHVCVCIHLLQSSDKFIYRKPKVLQLILI